MKNDAPTWKYDDSSWHSMGEFPSGFPPEAGVTHIGMFVTWAHLTDLIGELHRYDFPDNLAALRRHALTPGAYFIRGFENTFEKEDLDDEGNAFTAAYYSGRESVYLADYRSTVAKGLPSPYHVPDTWDTFERLRPILDARLRQWRLARPFAEITNQDLQPRRPWWRFW